MFTKSLTAIVFNIEVHICVHISETRQTDLNSYRMTKFEINNEPKTHSDTKAF